MNKWYILLEDEYGDTEVIDIVWYAPDMTAKEVIDSLINHDGYDPRITVALG